MGATGLIRIPDARMINDGDLRILFSHSYPYRNVAITFGFLPFLEIHGGFTTFMNELITLSGWENYGYNKDKEVGVKVLLLNEGKFWPSLVFGTEDFFGTGIFYTEYIVASKKIGPFDFTVGKGSNFLNELLEGGGKEPKQLKGLFGGVEWEIIPKFSLLFEYDPTEMTAGNIKESIDQHYNWGFRYKPFRWFDMGYSFQRGKNNSVCFSFTYPFGAQLFPQEKDEPFFGPVDHSSLFETNIREYLGRIKDYLIKEGFSDVKITLSDDFTELYVEYENNIYLSQVKAIGRVLRVVCAQSPSNIERINLIIKVDEVPMVKVNVSPKDFINFLNRKISLQEIKEKMEISSTIDGYSSDWGEDIFVEQKKEDKFFYGYKLFEIEPYINDPSDFFMARVGPTALLGSEIYKGFSFESYIHFPFYSDVKTNLPPISQNPIRSDIPDYLDDTGIVVENTFLNYNKRLGENGFGRITAGYMELEFAGVSAEYLKLFKDGRFGLGGEISWAKKRSSDSIFGLEDYSTITPYLKGYWFIPELDITLLAQAGKFLGKDEGILFQVNRYIRGGIVYGWYSKTDTSNFTGPNRNYSDKGIGFALPVRVFKTHDARGYYSYGFVPWSRDVGQVMYQPYSLYDFVFEFTPSYILKHFEEILE